MEFKHSILYNFDIFLLSSFDQGIQDAGFYRSQLLRVVDFIKDPKFPQNRQICETTYRKLPNILQIKYEHMYTFLSLVVNKDFKQSFIYRDCSISFFNVPRFIWL